MQTSKQITHPRPRLFNRLQLSSIGSLPIAIKCSTENSCSCAVAERLGFAGEGVLRKSEKVGDDYFDQCLFAKVSELTY